MWKPKKTVSARIWMQTDLTAKESCHRKRSEGDLRSKKGISNVQKEKGKINCWSFTYTKKMTQMGCSAILRLVRYKSLSYTGWWLWAFDLESAWPELISGFNLNYHKLYSYNIKTTNNSVSQNETVQRRIQCSWNQQQHETITTEGKMGTLDKELRVQVVRKKAHS